MLRMTQKPNKEPTIIGGLKYQAVCLYRLFRYEQERSRLELFKLIMKGQVRRHNLVR